MTFAKENRGHTLSNLRSISWERLPNLSFSGSHDEARSPSSISNLLTISDKYLLPSLTSEELSLVAGRRLLVMGSGNGSNFEVLVHTLRPYGVLFSGMFCDRPGARIIERARRVGVPVVQPSLEAAGSRRKLNDAVEIFLSQTFDLLVLAGYMRILPPRIVIPYAGRVVNLHPSFLPAFPGINVIQKAYDAGVSETGVTVHLVDEGVDTGPILAQIRVPMFPGESVEQLEERIHLVEHQLYPWVILHLLASRLVSSPASSA